MVNSVRVLWLLLLLCWCWLDLCLVMGFMLFIPMMLVRQPLRVVMIGSVSPSVYWTVGAW